MAHLREVARKDGSTAYEVRWRAGGTFKQRTFPAKRSAERFALKIENELADGAATDIYVRRGKTVADVVEATMQIAATKLKPRSLLSYRQAYDGHILPTFGKRRVSAVTSQDVEKWVADLTASGLAPATVRNNYVALNKVYRYAARHRLISTNPCAGVELPRATGGDVFQPAFLTPHEVETLAAALDDVHPYGLLVRFAAYSGLRAGEIAGLRVRDVNLLRKEVRVERTLQRVKGGWVVGSPKSARSTRTVPILHAPLVDALAAYLAEHPHRTDPDAQLWPGRALGTHALDWDRTFDHQSFYRWYFKPALRKIGLAGTRFHDLRHTYASILFAAGIEVHKVSRWMGHASISTTDGIYAHLYEADHSHDAQRLARFVEREGASASSWPRAGAASGN